MRGKSLSIMHKMLRNLKFIRNSKDMRGDIPFHPLFYATYWMSNAFLSLIEYNDMQEAVPKASLNFD